MEKSDSYALGGRTVGKSVLAGARSPRWDRERAKDPMSSSPQHPKKKIAEHLRFMHLLIEPSAITIDGMALFSVSQF